MLFSFSVGACSAAWPFHIVSEAGPRFSTSNRPSCREAAGLRTVDLWMIFPNDPLERVREGMEVVDATGTRLGTVARVQVAIPEQPTHPPDSDLLDDMAQIVPSP